MNHFFNRFKSTHDGSGGTVSLYKKITFGSTKPRQRILVKGRVAFAIFALDRKFSRSSTSGNVHVFAFSMVDWLKTKKFIAERVEKAVSHPMDHFLWISGDFNYVKQGDKRLVVNLPLEQQEVPRGSRKWDALMQNMILDQERSMC